MACSRSGFLEAISSLGIRTFLAPAAPEVSVALACKRWSVSAAVPLVLPPPSSASFSLFLVRRGCPYSVVPSLPSCAQTRCAGRSRCDSLPFGGSGIQCFAARAVRQKLSWHVHPYSSSPHPYRNRGGASFCARMRNQSCCAQSN
jgi:hypothetical protein